MLETAMYTGALLIFSGMLMRWFSSLFAENKQ